MMPRIVQFIYLAIFGKVYSFYPNAKQSKSSSIYYLFILVISSLLCSYSATKATAVDLENLDIISKQSSRVTFTFSLGAVHKRRPQSEGDVQCGQGGGTSDADVRTLGAKNFLFFEIYGMSGGGLSQCGHFTDKGGGVNFLRFCADVLHRRPLITIGLPSTLKKGDEIR